MFLLFGAFIAGMLTVLAPCILPLLPVIIGGSISGDVADRKRPVVIALSLGASLIVFTLLLKATTLLVSIPPQAITYFSGTIIILLGIITLFPSLYATVLIKLGIEHRAQSLLGKSYRNRRALIGPIVTGAALGPVFSSCSPVYGYILATVLPVNFGQAIIYIIAYVLGLTIILLLIGFYGQRFISKIKFASNPKGAFQRIIALLFIVVGLLVFTGYDKRFQTWVSQHTPFNFDKLSSQFLPDSKVTINDKELFNVTPYSAPELKGLEYWINSEPLTLQQLRGKVVLLDFWTYSCINCIRNNPYLERWYEAYKDDGLVVLGIHAPEFAFEKIPLNVQKGVKDQHITYPVALDNDFATWNAFDNRSWPASYLIDAEGKVRRIHEGEGQYKESEEAIRQLLIENGAQLGAATVDGGDAPVTARQTPETYLGIKRASNFDGYPALGAASQSIFSLKQPLAVNYWSLGGTWKVESDKITAVSDSRLAFHVAAKDVYLVAGSDTPKEARVLIDGQPATASSGAGSDVGINGAIEIADFKLYKIASFSRFSDTHTVTIEVPSGVALNVFTFGS